MQMHAKILAPLFAAMEDEKLADHERLTTIAAGLKTLAEQKISLDTPDEKKRTLLTCAAHKKQVSVVELLLKNGASPDAPDGEYQSTPLIFAAGAGCSKTVKLFLDAKVNPNISINRRNGGTALMYAASADHVETMSVLLAAGANLEACQSEGLTALMCAAQHGKTRAVRFLITVRANLETRSQYGDTALIHAAGMGQTEVVRILLAARANIDVKNTKGRTALWMAVNTGAIEVVVLLVKHAAIKKDDFFLLWNFFKLQNQSDINTVQCLKKIYAVASDEAHALNARAQLYIEKLSGLHAVYRMLGFWLTMRATSLTVEDTASTIFDYANNMPCDDLGARLAFCEPDTIDFYLHQLKEKARQFTKMEQVTGSHSHFRLLSVFAPINRLLELKAPATTSSLPLRAGKGPVTLRQRSAGVKLQGPR